jgi:hypothetical protein
MIVCEDITSIVYGRIDLDNTPDAKREQVIKMEMSSKLSIVIPESLETNKDKMTYKVGYLFEFLRRLYPETTYDKTIEILNDRYHVFLGRRQIERHVKSYEEIKKRNS